MMHRPPAKRSGDRQEPAKHQCAERHLIPHFAGFFESAGFLRNGLGGRSIFLIDWR